MPRFLNGSELSGFIKERQAKSVRSLGQAQKVIPKLAIVQANDDPVINTYVRLKKKYGADILIDVDIHKIEQEDAPELLNKLNNDDSVHGIIIQLPLTDTSQTDEICNMVASHKDVDGLGENPDFQPATPLAILWLLAGYNVDFKDKKILIIGKGKLVGKPLIESLRSSGHDVTVADSKTKSLKAVAEVSDIIITATGRPGILTSEMIKGGAVVVDAGTASESGKIVGDVADDVYERDSITLTPKKGGVGPLTICALFENVIISASKFQK